MFYNNNLGLKSITYKKYNLASFHNGINTNIDEELLPIKTATNTYNFDFNNGALRSGLGIKECEFSYSLENRNLKKTFEFPEGVDVLAAWEFTRYNIPAKRYESILLIYCSDNYIYQGYLYMDNPLFIGMPLLRFSSIPKVETYNLDGKDSVIFSTIEDGVYIWNPTINPYKVESAPKITSMCFHYERLFATVSGEKRTIWFSDDLDPTNWNVSLNEGGFINLIDERGTSNKIISFDDYLYVFREFGINRITARATQEDFSVTELFTSSSRVYANTVMVCGDRVMFLANDGIYMFNGVTTTKLALNLENLLNCNYNDNAVAAYFNGKYYLACTMTFPDEDKIGCENFEEFKNNCLLEIDLKTYEMNILRGVDIRFLNTINNVFESSLLACFNNGTNIVMGQITSNLGRVFDEPTTKVWQSPKTSFSYPFREKLLKSLTLTSKHDLQIEINFDGRKKKFAIKGKDKPQSIYPRMKGYQMNVRFISNVADADVSNPQIVVGVL